MNRFAKIGVVTGLLLMLIVMVTGCLAPAAAEGEELSWFDQYGMIIFLVIIFAFFWFVMIRPQRKRQKEHQQMMQELQKGDRVITAGGIYGTIESLTDDSVVLKVEGGTTMRVARGSVVVMREK